MNTCRHTDEVNSTYGKWIDDFFTSMLEKAISLIDFVDLPPI